MGRGGAILAAALFSLAAGVGPGEYHVEPIPDPDHPCLLPGCELPAKHGGYCCGEHCRAHKAARKLERKRGAK